MAMGNSDIKSEDFPIPVLLDSGNSNTQLPDDIFAQFSNATGAIFDKEIGDFTIPCEFASSGVKMTFQFGGSDGPRVEVNPDQLAIRFDSLGVFTSGPNKGKDRCLSGIQGGGNGLAVLGDTFMRSAYLVYDLVNNEVGIAQTKFNVTDANIVPFDGMGAKIPNSTVTKNQIQF
jgi:hypothetical protein